MLIITITIAVITITMINININITILCPFQVACANTGDIQPEHLQPRGSHRDGGRHWARGHPHIPGICPKLFVLYLSEFVFVFV